MIRLIAIVGPTGVGKSAFGIEIARAVKGEIVNADSRLFYRGFDVGTAKPTPAQRQGVPHHLIDILDAREAPGLGPFLERARKTIADIAARGRMPVVVGGSGQYVRALLEGWNVPRVPPDPAFRRRMETVAAEHGRQAVFQLLARDDPAAAARIDPRNVRRVIRALEIARARRKRPPVAASGASAQAKLDPLVIGLTLPRETLYERIDRRTRDMLAAGWVDEVRRLLAAGVSRSDPGMTSIGYPDVAAYAAGEIDIGEARARIGRATRRLVRRQYGWFRLSDPRITWLSADPAGFAAGMRIVRELAARPAERDAGGRETSHSNRSSEDYRQTVTSNKPDCVVSGRMTAPPRAERGANIARVGSSGWQTRGRDAWRCRL